MITLKNVQKVRVDNYFLHLDWPEIQALIRERVEQKLQDPHFMNGDEVKLDQPLQFSKGEIEIQMKQTEQGSPSYKVDEFTARVTVQLTPPNLPPEA